MSENANPIVLRAQRRDDRPTLRSVLIAALVLAPLARALLSLTQSVTVRATTVQIANTTLFVIPLVIAPFVALTTANTANEEGFHLQRISMLTPQRIAEGLVVAGLYRVRVGLGLALVLMALVVVNVRLSADAWIWRMAVSSAVIFGLRATADYLLAVLVGVAAGLRVKHPALAAAAALGVMALAWIGASLLADLLREPGLALLFGSGRPFNLVWRTIFILWDNLIGLVVAAAAGAIGWLLSVRWAGAR